MTEEKTVKSHKKLKIAGLVLFLLVLMAAVAFFVYFMIREQKRAAHFENAVETFEKGDYPLARRMFHQVISYDKNNEKAYVYLAKIAQAEGLWEREAENWKQCMQLNQLEPSYKDNYCRALARARNFSVLATQFRQEFLKNAKLSDEHTFFCLLSNAAVNGWKATEDFRKNLQEKQPEFFKTEYGRCVNMLMAWGEGKNPNEEDPELEELSNSKDPYVAFEALNIKSELFRRKKDEKGVEETLKKQTEINKFCGLPLLAYFHMMTYKFKQAAEEYSEAWELFKRPIDAMMYGESLLLSDQRETLQEFSSNFRVGGKGGILAGNYLECLAAFSAGDMEKLSKTLPRLEPGFGTPITLLMQMVERISFDKQDEVAKCWMTYLNTRPFYDFNHRIDEMMHGYIHTTISKKKLDVAGNLLLLPRINWKRDEVCAQLYIAQRLRKDLLTEKELQEALKLYPKEALICQCGAEFYYKKDKLDECMKLIDQALALKPRDDTALKLLQTFVLARRGRVDEAAPKLMQAAIERKKDSSLLRMFCEYCVKVNRKDYLDKLAKALESDEGRQGLRHFVVGQALIMDKKEKEALDELEQVDCEDGDILFGCAVRLAVNDRHEPALRLYQKMLKLFPDNPHTAIVKANMSEIYLATGKQKEAIAIAEEAYKQSPGDDRLLVCYADKLNVAGDKAKLIQTLPLAKLLSLKNEKLTAAWKAAAETEIPRLFDEGSKWASEELCMNLLKLDANSPVATEYMKKLHPEDEKEKAKKQDAEAKKQAEKNGEEKKP